MTVLLAPLYAEGHTRTGNDLTFVTQTWNANGRTPVLLPTPLNTATRGRNFTTTESNFPTGMRVFLYTGGPVTNGVPDDEDGVYLVVNAVDQKSQKASTAFSSKDYFLLTQVTAGILKQQSASANVILAVKPPGGVYEHTYLGVIDSGAQPTSTFNFSVPQIILPNSRVQILVDAEGSGDIQIVASFAGWIATIK